MRKIIRSTATLTNLFPIKKHTSDYAVSEIVGTLLLISIGISLVLVLAMVTITVPYAFFSSQSPSASIIGTVTENSVILEHHGGDPVPIDAMIYLNFAETPYNISIKNVLNSSAQADGYWNIGERIVIPYTGEDLTTMQVSIVIVDTKSNSIILRGILHSGSAAVIPYVRTLDADGLKSYAANLHMYFDFRGHNLTRNVRFMYIKSSVFQSNSSAIWTSTGWTSVALNNGTINTTISGLDQNSVYLFRASIQYNKTGSPLTILIVNGSTLSFTTPSSAVGIWHFDELSGLVAIDSSGNGNHGLFSPYDATLGPTRINNHVVNNRSLSFDGIGDYVKVNSSASLNITKQITIETWVNPNEDLQLVGSNPSRIDMTVFGKRNYSCYEPNIIKVSNDVFAVVSRNSSNKGYLITVKITGNGDIIENATTCITDLFNFEKGNCERPVITKVNGSSDIYAIAYRGKANGLNVTTIAIASNGSINKVPKSSLRIDVNNSYFPKIVHTVGDTYAVAYSVWRSYLGPNRYIGQLRTIRITNVGIISKMKHYDFGITNLIYAVMQYPDIIPVFGENYSIVFRDSDTDGAIRGVKILSDGSILPQATNDKFDNDNISDTPLKILQVYNNVYAILYGDKIGNMLNGGAVMTVMLDPIGTLNATVGYAEMNPAVEKNNFFDPDFIRINGSVFGVVYNYALQIGTVKTIEINNTGAIVSHLLDPAWKFQFDSCTYGLNYPRIVEVNASNDMFAIVYLKKLTNTDLNNGALVTMKIADNGTISKKLLDSVLLGAVNFFMPGVVHISGNVYAIVGQRWPGDTNITIRTFTISPGGLISKYCIDSKTFSLKNVWMYASESRINIVHINQSIYALVFHGRVPPTWPVAIFLRTVSIADNGSIGSTFLGALNITKQLTAGSSSDPIMTRVAGNIFAVSYHTANATHSDFVSTVQISLTGNITLIDTFTYKGYAPVSTWEENSEIIPVNGNSHVFAVLYCYDYNPGINHKGLAILITLFIDTNGHINQTPLAIFPFDSYGCSRPNMIYTSGNNYAIVYSNCVPSGAKYLTYGYVRTVNISSNGKTIKNIDVATFNITLATSDISTFQTITYVFQNIYGVAFTLPNNPINYPPHGYAGALRIAPNGEISRTDKNVVLDFQFSLYSKNCTAYPLSFTINNNILAIVYRGFLDDGFIETINMTKSSNKKTMRNILSKQNAYVIKANDTKVIATLTTTGGDKSLTLPIHNGWNYIVLSYNHSKMKLYNNVTTNTSLACNLDLKTSPSQLIFGGFSGIYDEFVVYNSGLTDDFIWSSFKKYTPT